MHFAELTSVTFVKYHYNMLTIYLHILVTFHKNRKFLNRGDDNVASRIIQLAFQDRYIGIAICCILLKVIIFTHRLIVQILTIHHKQHLIYI